MLLGHIRGCRDKPRGPTEHKEEGFFQNEAKALRTHAPETLTEHLVHARQSAEVTKMNKTQTLPPSSSQTKRLGDGGERQACHMLACAKHHGNTKDIRPPHSG